MQPQRIMNKPKRLTQKILILNALKDGSVLSQLDVYQ